MQYYCSYVLGFPAPAGTKADKGSCTHRTLEVLAVIKKALQDGGISTIMDDAIGEVEVDEGKLHTDAFVRHVSDRAYDYYSTHSVNKFAKGDREDVYQWAMKVCKSPNDPRILDIVAPESQFDIELPYEWAKYSYPMPDGSVLAGSLRLKGTMDLIHRLSPTVLELSDYKTGKRYNWAKDTVKTFDDLCKDEQLLLYYYACNHLYHNQCKHIIVSINWINDGGNFTLNYGPNDLMTAERILQEKFELIKETRQPRLNKTWKCSKLCHFGKNEHPSGDINPRTGAPHTICSFMEDSVRVKGMERTNMEQTQHGFSLAEYQIPGL